MSNAKEKVKQEIVEVLYERLNRLTQDNIKKDATIRLQAQTIAEQRNMLMNGLGG